MCRKLLNQRGYRVYTGVVGPFSSNWDRACELYAQIKGGTVDYGQAHACFHSACAHTGEPFPVCIPIVTQPMRKGQRKIHLIGHEQGSQTSRVLTMLLEQGSDSTESGATPKE